MKVLNLDTGEIEERVDPWEGKREELSASQSFWRDKVRYAGYCIKCKKPVLWGDHVVDINKICGRTRVDISHRRCL